MAPKLLAAAELENKETLELETPRQCYVCKTDFTKMHHFYDTMCTDCGDFNYAKRFQTANVKGRLLSLRVHD
jgi:tRNA U54 and U55 pseudouridine synthase Pus10